jgi:hypothetical protein
VEIIAARRIGRETVQYVSNVYKNYTAYRLIVNKINLKKGEAKGSNAAAKWFSDRRNFRIATTSREDSLNVWTFD